MTPDVRIGCSGWNYKAWREVLYEPGLPANRWLERYAERFDTVELNTSFYRLVKPENARRWAEQTPAGFTFAAKASQYMTHMKRLTDLPQSIERYYAGIQPLKDAGKLGPIVWQLPPNFKRDDERLEQAAAQLPGEDRHAWEFRHPSWFEPEAPTLDILRAYGHALVIGDRPQVHDFQPHAFTTDWTLVRFHYGTRGRRGNYSDTEVDEWAERIDAWPVDTAYVYFNNDWEGFAIRNALRMLKRRERASGAAPAAAATAGSRGRP